MKIIKLNYSNLIKLSLQFVVIFNLIHQNSSSPSFGSPSFGPSLYDPGDPDPDQNRNLIQLIESRGYNVQQHLVETKDGYILKTFRLINPKLPREIRDNLRPVLLFHGLFGSACDFCINSPLMKTNESQYGDTIAFALAQTNRYDIWLANARGTRYSLRHRTLTPSDREFWHFSFDQMATMDLPANLDYIRNRTGSKTVGYVGFSQGTLIMFTLLSLQPEYADIVQPFVALAPATFVGNIDTPIRDLVPLEILFFLVGGEFLPSPGYIQKLIDKFCTDHYYEKLCANFLFLFLGPDFKNLNETRFGVYLNFEPSTTSSWNLVHYAQLVRSKQFKRFDYYWPYDNMKHYGQLTAPDIPLENIPKHTKIALFQGLNDHLADQADLAILKNILINKNGIKLLRDFYVSDPQWNHLDFIFGKNAGRLFINEVINVLDQYTIPK